jgi:outer membrane lipoprotein SlyB
MTKGIRILAITSLIPVLAGCAHPMGSRDYERRQVGVEQEVRMGVVAGVREVKIQAGSEAGVGTAAGAIVGGIAGSTVGGGHRANAAGAVVGAVVGGLIGNQIEQSNNERRGVEVTVTLDGGRTVAITQEADEEFRVGDRVRLLTAKGKTRVTRI